MKKTLECSSKGDKRYSALYAKLKLGDVTKSIEDWYQHSKVFANGVQYTDFRQAKGKVPQGIIIDDEWFPAEFLTAWYKLLWLLYLDSRPELVIYAKQFDDFTDMFRGKAINCQADVIKQYVKSGRQSVYQDCKPLLDLMAERGMKFYVKEQPPQAEDPLEEARQKLRQYKLITKMPATPIAKVSDGYKHVAIINATGHRPKDLGGYNENSPKIKWLKEETRKKLWAAYKLNGTRVFIAGGALGYDTWFAEIALEIKQHDPAVLLIIAIPCLNQEKRWPKEAQERYHNILAKADGIFLVYDGDFDSNPGCMDMRNHWMVDQSMGTMAGWIRSKMKGGTFNCVNYALKMRKPVFVLDPETRTTHKL